MKAKKVVVNRAIALDQNKKASPLSDAEMDVLMAGLGPFECEPHIAVAVSGGADSLALTLLCKKWVDKRSGTLSALSIDHGLREGSCEELKKLGQWLLALDIDQHVVLTWIGDKPHKGLQEAARIARYDLLENWCRKNNVLHLLLGHHQDDQAETFLMRLAHKSGLNGLAGMADVIEKSHVRLLRPFLTTPKDRLCETLKVAMQPWLEDSSNKNEKFERVRVRNSLPKLVELGLTPVKICKTVERMAHTRIALESEASKLLAISCTVYTTGYVSFNAAKLFSGPEEISLRAIAQALLCVGGSVYAPGLAKLESLHEKMKTAFRDLNVSWRGTTVAGCRILPLSGRLRGVNFLICREERSLPAALPIFRSMVLDWDSRFQLQLMVPELAGNSDAILQPLGRNGWAALCREDPSIQNIDVPVPVIRTLPTLTDNDGIVAVPNLNYQRDNRKIGNIDFTRAAFHPRQSLSGRGFTVAK